MAKPPRRPAPKKNGSPPPIIVTSVKIRAELHNRARHHALDHNQTWQELLDEALEDYLRRKGA